jgi:CheY-like chemotaxis protein
MSDLSLRSMAEGQRRILVLEDDRETAEQLVDSLSNSGYQVDLAVDGDDGLRRGRSNEYAVMTIDRILPGLDGLIVLRRLREDGIVTPALTSALGGTDGRVHGLRAGGDDYLIKPFACGTAGPRRRPGPPQRDGGQGNGAQCGSAGEAAGGDHGAEVGVAAC